MIDIASADCRNREHDEYVGGAELPVDHSSVAEGGAQAQVAFDERRQIPQRRLRADRLLPEHVHGHMARAKGADAPWLGGARIMMQKAQRQGELVRVRPFKAGAADHHVYPVMSDIGPDAMPQELYGSLVAVGGQHAGAAEFEKA